MTVWVLAGAYQYYPDVDNTIGIFSTKEKAEKAKKEFMVEDWQRTHFDYEITEYEVL